MTTTTTSTSTPRSTFTFTDSNESDWSQPDFWIQICPHLRISQLKKASTDGVTTSNPSPDAVSRFRQEQLRNVGFVEIDDKLDETLIESLRLGIENLYRVGLPATCILLYDETWKLALASRSILHSVTHPNHQFGYDILAWRIETSGFSPHRDRQPKENVKTTFTSDDDDDNHQFDPDFVTHWIALTDAMPSNSCLYVIPANHDPGYYQGDNDDVEQPPKGKNPLEMALPNKYAYQNIRAIPRKAGESVVFTHRILHWGSTRTHGPHRMAISFVSADPNFEAPYIQTTRRKRNMEKNDNDDAQDDDGSLAFSNRLLLVCAQLLVYHERFDLSAETIQACYNYCKRHEKDLEESYRRKVSVEYVRAMKETKATGDDADSDREEAVLEAMLDQEKDLSDDYDELSSGNEEMVHSENNDSDGDDDDAQYGNVTLFGKRESSDDMKKNESKRAKK